MSDNPFASPESHDSTQPAQLGRGSKLLKVAFIGAILVVLGALIIPSPRRAREAARRTQCKVNLKQIGLALHNYHDDYGSFPPAYTVDSNGRMLHSWRTLILPYLEQEQLYRQIDLSKPWYDPANAAALETSVAAFQCPSANIPKNHTIYLGVSGDDCCFRRDRPLKFADIKDGTSNTLLIVEVPQDRTVPWMSPQDADEATILSIANGSKVAHTGGFQATLADGSVRFISVQIDRGTLRALMTTSGNEVVGEF